VLALDVFERTVTAADGPPAEGRELARALEAEMDDDMWGLFLNLFRKVKARMMEELDPDAIDIALPAREIRQGLLFEYRRIFPWADTFSCVIGPDRWVAVDAYCLRPGCPCSEVELQLFRVGGESSPPEDTLAPSAFLFFDYRTGKARLEEASPGCPRAGEFIGVLRKARPALKRTLRTRHDQLRRIAERSLGSSRSDPAGRAPVPDKPPAVGRNDPCPCGSGKKFKKCCG